MSKSCEIKVSNDGAWLLVGSLTMQTVPSVMRFAKKQKLPKEKWVINLSKAKKIDSSGLALLLSWYVMAKQNKITYHVKSMPEQTSALMTAQGLVPVLENTLI